MAKSSAQRTKEHRQRLREKGLVPKEVWILPEHSRHLKNIEMAYRSNIFETEYFSDMSIEVSPKTVKEK